MALHRARPAVQRCGRHPRVRPHDRAARLRGDANARGGRVAGRALEAVEAWRCLWLGQRRDGDDAGPRGRPRKAAASGAQVVPHAVGVEFGARQAHRTLARPAEGQKTKESLEISSRGEGASQWGDLK